MLLPRTGTQHFLLDTCQAKGECEILGGEPEKILATAHPVLADARRPRLMRRKPASGPVFESVPRGGSFHAPRATTT